jgi:hypothetical protein
MARKATEFHFTAPGSSAINIDSEADAMYLTERQSQRERGRNEAAIPA